MVYAKNDSYESGMPIFRKDHGTQHRGKFACFVRVSTDKQDVENQVYNIKQYLNGGDHTVKWFKEEGVSGALPFAKRPVLKEALEYCRKEKATLVVYSLSRFSRKMWETTKFFEEEVHKKNFKFIVVDNPMLDHKTIGFHATMNYIERENIRERTSASFKRIKAEIAEKGYYKSKSGNIIKILGVHDKLQEAGQKGADAVKKNADDFARDNLPLIKSLLDEDNGYRDVARILNQRGIPSFKGGVWYASTVSNLLKRSGAGSKYYIHKGELDQINAVFEKIYIKKKVNTKKGKQK